MSKITFRADEELVERLEAFDASKSEVMRDALRAYLDDAEANDRGGGDPDGSAAETGVDAALAERVDELIAERLDEHLGQRGHPGYGRPQPAPSRPQDVNVNVTVDGVPAETAETTEATATPAAESDREAPSRKTGGANAGDGGTGGGKTCNQCGENMSSDHVYCPNCGEKASHRVFCDCGDEIRSDWAFCPSCGRRTPAADVLDPSERP
jgi:Arc/MetJ-type ribon-helix-helix transcriptional regulator/RNA polymerase subunit RPABC4/transcription elongation factor Spt4